MGASTAHRRCRCDHPPADRGYGQFLESYGGGWFPPASYRCRAVCRPNARPSFKVLAGRLKDLEDVRTVLTERLNRLDVAYIRSTLGMLEQALGQSDLLPVLDAEIARAERQLP